ncbi:tryptophan synthase subunit alpha [Sporolactobacillus shoreae]|uniref:Tryptophan synthase alpha chain n=1 Tax=Sporolactobacillus shoreae TaxID=1465501 RepID=A0A4Z0GRB0_9BACL|nr:tryptophan synthase subunit alpha [Sporolactobacillus shoreae]TGA99121.1 tryptophan synthase subunit alpha [Sporolactobacillus shoreae]
MNGFEHYVQKNHGMLFIPFIVAGDPNEEATVDLALTMQKCGASALELGIPYSDPLADGPVIQRASKRALAGGMTLLRAMRLVNTMRQKGLNIPVVIFTYANPLLQLGLETFFHEAAVNGIDGLLVPDIPYEESRPLAKRCVQENVRLISLVAPTTSDERLEKICASAQGFIYCVSSLGVTGVRKKFHPDIFPFLERVRQATSLPIAVGFGISSREQTAELKGSADGFIVGSAIVSEIEKRADQLKKAATRATALDELKETLLEKFGTPSEKPLPHI